MTLNRIAPVFVVDNVKEAIEWYQKAFGLSIKYINNEDDDPASWNYALLEKDEIEIHLCLTQPDDKTLKSESNCYLFLSNLGELHKHLTDIKADVSEIQPMPWGHNECFLNDKYGNRIVLSEPEDI